MVVFLEIQTKRFFLIGKNLGFWEPTTAFVLAVNVFAKK